MADAMFTVYSYTGSSVTFRAASKGEYLHAIQTHLGDAAALALPTYDRLYEMGVNWIGTDGGGVLFQKAPCVAPPPIDPLIRQRFDAHAARWKAERGPHSSVGRLCDHPSYRAIVEMGLPVIPLLLEELRREPDHWFLALHQLTDVRPVTPENFGKVGAMARQWVAWGVLAGHISPEATA